jgi:hypothetical protein
VDSKEPLTSPLRRKRGGEADEQPSAKRTRVADTMTEDKLVPEPQAEISAQSLECTPCKYL